jgi:hypothetical protein
VLVFDDMLPRSSDEASRHRHTRLAPGDVYKAAQALRDYRPDTVVIEVDTTPTGVGVVLLPDASRNGVLPEFDDWLEMAVAPDPQHVPDAVLTRSRAAKPEELLASTGWAELVRLRKRPRTPADAVRAAVQGSFARFTA